MSPQYENNFEINRRPQVLMKHFFRIYLCKYCFTLNSFFCAGSCWYFFKKICESGFRLCAFCGLSHMRHGVFILILLFFPFLRWSVKFFWVPLLTVRCIYHVLTSSSSFYFSFSPHRLMFNAPTKADKLNRQIFLIRHELSLKKLRKRSNWDMSAIVIRTRVVLMEKNVQRWEILKINLFKWIR